jgi:hypothetical protein
MISMVPGRIRLKDTAHGPGDDRDCRKVQLWWLLAVSAGYGYNINWHVKKRE